jgi:hypothetical protein
MGGEVSEGPYRVSVLEVETGDPFFSYEYADVDTAVAVARNLRRYYVEERHTNEFTVKLKRRNDVSPV